MHSSALNTIAAFVASVILILSHFQPSRGFEDVSFNKELENLQHSGVTVAEIDKWWKRVKQERKKQHPRVFPLCVTKDEDGEWPKKLSSFKKILNSIDKGNEREFKPKDHMLNVDYNFGVKNFSLSAVYIKATKEELSDGLLTLRQWVKVTLTFVAEEEIKGMYVQSITGPLGLPGGEFLADIRCRNTHEFASYKAHEYTLPCSFTPRTASFHPNVFVFDGSKVKARFARADFTYRWTEAQCQETGFFQFLIITTTNFNTHEVFLTQVFHYSKMDSETGLYTPFTHIFENNTECTEGAPKGLTFFEKDTHRVVPHLEYDNCVTKGEGRLQSDLGLDTCPPGYFECETSWRNAQEWQTKNNARKEFMEMFDNFQDCCELGKVKQIQTTTTTTTTSTTTTTTTPTTTTTTPTTTTTTPTTTTTTPTTTTTTPTTTKKTPTTTTTTPTTTKKTPTTTTPTTTTPTTTTTTPTTTKKTPTTTKKIPTTTKKTPTTTKKTPKTTRSPPPSTVRTTKKSTTMRTTTTPPSTTTTTLKPYQHQEKAGSMRARIADKENKITHGDLCIFVWFVIIPIADHISRFYKDFPDFEDLGLGFWIIAHVAFHSMGLVIIWYSFGLVVGTGDDKLGNISGLHFLFGLTVTIMHHVDFTTALFRDIGGESRVFQSVLIHSVCGYAGYILSIIMVMVSQANPQRKWFCFTLFLVRLVCLLVSSCLEWKQDQKIGVVGHRAQFPILQRIMIDEPPPYRVPKVIILVLMVVIKVGICVYIVVSTPKATHSDLV